MGELAASRRRFGAHVGCAFRLAVRPAGKRDAQPACAQRAGIRPTVGGIVQSAHDMMEQLLGARVKICEVALRFAGQVGVPPESSPSSRSHAGNQLAPRSTGGVPQAETLDRMGRSLAKAACVHSPPAPRLRPAPIPATVPPPAADRGGESRIVTHRRAGRWPR